MTRESRTFSKPICLAYITLGKEQKRHGVDAVIAAPGQREEVYWHDQTRVWRIPVSEDVRDLRELYGEGDSDAAR